MITRKRIDQLTPAQQQQFVDAVKKLKAEQVQLEDGTTTGIYDIHVAIHLGVRKRFKNVRNIGDGGHRGPAFLPWHREYLRRIEKDLQMVSDDPEFALPYWDWTKPELLDVIFSDSLLGPDGAGDFVEGYPKGLGLGGKIVPSGPFTKANGWTLDKRLHIAHPRFLEDEESTDTITFGEDLLRYLSSEEQLPSEKQITDFFTSPNFDTYAKFRTMIEQGPRLHNDMHGWVGGTMGISSSPYDPVFLLNHTFIDYVWALWQSFGHWGEDYYYLPKTRPSDTDPLLPEYGHYLNEPMWPWDAGESKVHPKLELFVPSFDNEPARTPADVLDCRQLDYSYADWPHVQSLITNILDEWSAKRNGRQPKLTLKHEVNRFDWDTPENLASIEVFDRFPLIESDKVSNGRGIETYLVRALKDGVGTFGRMPRGGPYLPEMEIAKISHWVDMGMPTN